MNSGHFLGSAVQSNAPESTMHPPTSTSRKDVAVGIAIAPAIRRADSKAGAAKNPPGLLGGDG